MTIKNTLADHEQRLSDVEQRLTLLEQESSDPWFGLETKTFNLGDRLTAIENYLGPLPDGVWPAREHLAPNAWRAAPDAYSVTTHWASRCPCGESVTLNDYDQKLTVECRCGRIHRLVARVEIWEDSNV